MCEPTLRQSESSASDSPDTVILHDYAMGQLDHIHHTMARTSSFTGASGLSTALQGVLTLVVSAATWNSEPKVWLVWWACLGSTAFVIGFLGMYLKARRQAQLLSGPAGRRFLLGLVPPLAAGLLLSVVLHTKGMPELLPGVWLLTFGLGVTAAGIASTPVVPLMGLSFVLLSPFALLGPVDWSRPLLALGFGVFSIVFGILIARRHGG